MKKGLQELRQRRCLGACSGGWRALEVAGQARLVVPLLVTGCKLWHLREGGSFYPKTAWANALASIPDGSLVRCQPPRSRKGVDKCCTGSPSSPGGFVAGMHGD